MQTPPGLSGCTAPPSCSKEYTVAHHATSEGERDGRLRQLPPRVRRALLLPALQRTTAARPARPPTSLDHAARRPVARRLGLGGPLAGRCLSTSVHYSWRVLPRLCPRPGDLGGPRGDRP